MRWPEEAPRRQMSSASLLALAFMISLIGGAGLHLILTVVKGEKPAATAGATAAAKAPAVVVPDLRSVSVGSARTAVKQIGLMLRVEGSYIEGGTEGASIAWQSPLPGSLIAAGDPVVVKVSGTSIVAAAPTAAATGTSKTAPPAATPTIRVPAINGIGILAASRTLKEAGLSLGLISEEASEAPEGAIFRQDPSPDTPIAAGSSVDIVVSKGSSMPTVPQVARQTEDRARRHLIAAGYRVSVTEMFHPSLTTGRVIRTNPKAGEPLEKGSKVELIVVE